MHIVFYNACHVTIPLYFDVVNQPLRFLNINLILPSWISAKLRIASFIRIWADDRCRAVMAVCYNRSIPADLNCLQCEIIYSLTHYTLYSALLINYIEVSMASRILYVYFIIGTHIIILAHPLSLYVAYLSLEVLEVFQ